MNPDISTSSPNDFKVAVENSVSVPKDSRIRIVLDEIKVGMLHSYPESKGLTGLPEYEGLGGKELWLVMDATTLENVDPLGLKSKRITAASNVKIDRESFTFLSLDDAERIPFDQLMNTSYRVEFKLYEVNGLELKKAIFQTAQKSIGLQTWNALETTVKSAGVFMAGEVIEIFKEKTKEPLFLRKSCSPREQRWSFLAPSI